MAKEGYIQTKVSELSSKVTELEELIISKEKYLEELHKKIILSIEETSKTFAPIIELKKGIIQFKKDILENNNKELCLLKEDIQKNVDFKMEKILKEHKSNIHNSVYTKLEPYLKEQLELIKADRQIVQDKINKDLNQFRQNIQELLGKKVRRMKVRNLDSIEIRKE